MTDFKNFYKYTLDSNNAIPLYFQLKKVLRQMIDNQELLPGAMIPKEATLCEIFNISRTTVRLALNELVNEGVFYRVKGHGTFLPINKITTLFTPNPAEVVGRILNENCSPSFHMISCTPTKPPYTVAQALALEKDWELLCVKELIQVNKQKLAISSTYYANVLDDNTQSEALSIANITQVLKTYSMSSLSYISRSFFTTSANYEDIRLLEIPRSTQIQVIYTTGTNALNQPIVFNELRYRGDITIFKF